MSVIQPSDAALERNRQSQVTDPVARFARGDISRKQAMAELGGISYGCLIDRVVERGLTLPSLPDAELERMAADLVCLLNTQA
jgi:hypothetical protein